MSIKNDTIININLVLERILDFSKARSDSELANVLGVSRQVLFGWKSRGAIPYEKLIEFAIEKKIDINWLLTGAVSTNKQLDEPINFELFKEIQSVMQPELGSLNAIDFGYFTAIIYNDVYLEENKLIRSQFIKKTTSMLMLTRARVQLESAENDKTLPLNAKNELIEITKESIERLETEIANALKEVKNIISHKAKGDENQFTAGNITINGKIEKE